MAGLASRPGSSWSAGRFTAGFRILFRDRPWQPILLCAYVVFVGHVALGSVIDTDHWRHFYLLIGLVWGAIALEYRHQYAARTARPTEQLRGL